jgi:hypothetical protein
MIGSEGMMSDLLMGGPGLGGMIRDLTGRFEDFRNLPVFVEHFEGTLFQWYWQQDIDKTLRTLGANLYSLLEEEQGMLLEELGRAVAFIQNKYSLPGPPVRKGGQAGPSPGSVSEPVLHQDTGALRDSVYFKVNGKKFTAERYRIGRRWRGARDLRVGARFEAEIGTNPDISRIDERGREHRPFLYASNHEYGHNVPPRPAYGPANDILDSNVRIRSAQIMARWNTAATTGLGGGQLSPMGTGWTGGM